MENKFHQVYFARIRQGNKPYIKIGITSDPLYKRLSFLQAWPKNVSVSMLYAIPVSDIKAEHWFHQRFADKLHHGREWFSGVTESEIETAILAYEGRAHG